MWHPSQWCLFGLLFCARVRGLVGVSAYPSKAVASFPCHFPASGHFSMSVCLPSLSVWTCCCALSLHLARSQRQWYHLFSLSLLFIIILPLSWKSWYIALWFSVCSVRSSPVAFSRHAQLPVGLRCFYQAVPDRVHCISLHDVFCIYCGC